MKKLIYIISIIILMTSCKKDTLSINNPNKNKEAEKVIIEFYTNISKNDYQSASGLFGKIFYEKTSKGELLKILENINSKFGKLKRINILKWTNRINDTKEEYTMEYEATYEKVKLTERFLLTNEDEVIKIVGYRITSNDLLN